MDATASHHFDSAPKGQTQPARRYTCGRRASDWRRAFAATPIVRTEAVARAKELIADGHYPPSETINEIASLLGHKLTTARDIRRS